MIYRKDNGYRVNTTGELLGLLEFYDTHPTPRAEVITLDPENKRVTSAELVKLASALQSKEYASEIHFQLHDSVHLDEDAAKALSDLCFSDIGPDSLKLSLSNNALGPDIAKHLAPALGAKGRKITLYLSQSAFGNEGAKYFADELANGHYPEETSLNLPQNNMGPTSAEYFANALMSGNCRDNLLLELSHNPVGAQGAVHFARALKSKKYPEFLKLHLDGCHIGNEGVIALAQVFLDVGVNEGFSIRLSSYSNDNEMELLKTYILTEIRASLNALGNPTLQREQKVVTLQQATQRCKTLSTLFPNLSLQEEMDEISHRFKILVALDALDASELTDTKRTVYLQYAINGFEALSAILPYHMIQNESADILSNLLGELRLHDSSSPLDPGIPAYVDAQFQNFETLVSQASLPSEKLALVMHSFALAYGELALRSNADGDFKQRDKYLLQQAHCTKRAIEMKPENKPENQITTHTLTASMVRFTPDNSRHVKPNGFHVYKI